MQTNNDNNNINNDYTIDNLLIVEDDSRIREKLFSRIKNIPSVSNIHLAGTLQEATDVIEKVYSEIIVLDLNLPDGNGIQLLRWIREKNINSRILIFSINKELKSLCLKNGACAFFDKSRDFDLLIKTIENFELNSALSPC